MSATETTRLAWDVNKAGDFAGFDVETSGVNVETDRIVTATFHAYGCEPIDLLINPGVPIPEAASAIHGITDETAQDGFDPPEALRRIHGAIQDLWDDGKPLIGYNIVYDLSILDRELRRHLGFGLTVNGPVIDGLVLDRAADPYRKGSRKLADVARHWGCQVIEEDLHTSRGDVLLAVRVAFAILRNGELYDHGAPDEEEMRLAAFSLKDLHFLQVEAYAQQRASFNSWLRGQGRVPDDENTVWPLKPFNGKVG